ncbi:hypothetical protein T11_11625 [Trichinella zimbabwensis]|uniref:Uncharacterized protein n=1 Tax=Trichinella zimbabwensis TaxID=268475 RepID=A0A0V1HCJ9_9BILA|nr:hypothetical protein T11_11625 [Trichinella zimbabwensis]
MDTKFTLKACRCWATCYTLLLLYWKLEENHQSSSAPSSSHHHHHHHRHLDNQLRKSPESNISKKKELMAPALIFQTGHYKNGVTDGICFYNL